MLRDRRRWARRRAGALSPIRVLVVVGVALVLAGVAAGSVSQVAPASAPYRRDVARSFALLVAPVAARSQATGATLRGVLGSGPSMGRRRFFAVLSTVRHDSQAELSDLTVPPPLLPAGGDGCVAALRDRASAAAGMAAALEDLLGGPGGSRPSSPSTASAGLARQGGLVLRSDAAWASCRAELGRGPGHVRIPTSRWAPDPALWSASSLAATASAVAGSSTLAVRHDLLILSGAVGFSPPVLADSNGAAVLPPTPTVTVRLVLANHGNVDERGVVVRLAVTGGRVPPVEEVVDVAAGGSTAVDPPPLHVPPGLHGTLTVSVDGPSGAGRGVSIPIAVAPAPPPSTTTTTTTTAPRTSTRGGSGTAAAHPGGAGSGGGRRPGSSG